MSRVAGGDADALGELYDRYGRVVFGLIYRMLGSPESAEEVAQNAFHSVWRQASRYRPERGSVRTWLLAIARNAAIDWRRSKGNRTGRETAIDDTLMLVDERRVEDTVIASLRAQRVRAAVAETAERDVPDGVRSKIVERARREGAPRRAPSSSFFDLFRRPAPLAIPVALAVLLLVSLAAYAGARRDSDRYASALSGIAGARVVALAPTGEVAGVRGSLVIPTNGAAPYLILDLPAAPSGKTWEAWVLRGETPLAAGITNDRGVTTLLLTAPLTTGDGVAVTLEPSGGVDRVTGNPVLAGKT